VPLAQEQLGQVLLNLVLNARDAMPRGGTITLAAKQLDEPAQVRIEVRDTGTGIRPEILPRVFEPFFTTKGDAGNGLGLMIAKEVIEHAGGTIRIDSQYGKGTTILIDLPRAASAASA
jgi:two-component system NtrC family sensor kinase